MKGNTHVVNHFGLNRLLWHSLLFSAQLIVKAAMDKGYEDQGLKLAFIIVFATPASAAMIVAALPDKRLQTSVSDNPVLSTIDAELPKL